MKREKLIGRIAAECTKNQWPSPIKRTAVRWALTWADESGVSLSEIDAGDLALASKHKVDAYDNGEACKYEIMNYLRRMDRGGNKIDLYASRNLSDKENLWVTWVRVVLVMKKDIEDAAKIKKAEKRARKEQRNKDTISIVWIQLREILQSLKDNHNAEVGISYDTIDSAIKQYLETQK